VLLAAGRTAHKGRRYSTCSPMWGRMTGDIAITRNSLTFLGSAEGRARFHSQGPPSASRVADVIERVP
jgi:hypothetical protein